MASVKHYNNIKIARGTRSKWITGANPSYGELFYDKGTKGTYIVTGKDEDTGNAVLERFGGMSSVVLKGTINQTNYSAVCAAAEVGDAYIVTGPISVVQPELVFDNAGNITRGESNRTYDDYFKNGQVIIFTDKDVSTIPNAVVLDSPSSDGAKGIVTLAGTAEATDLEYDGSRTEVATAVTDVQTALDNLFNEKMEYVGSFNTITVTGTETISESYTAATEEDKMWARVAQQQKLLIGQSMVYSGETKTITVGEDTVTFRANTVIVNNAGVIYTIPLGAGDAGNITVELNENVQSDEDTPTFNTKDTSGAPVLGMKLSEVKTIQNFVDYVTKGKADLNSNGKIPLNEMPSTLIGALQYIGTVTLDPATKNSYTSSEFATLMNAAKEGSWEKDGPGSDVDTYMSNIASSSKLNEAFNSLDEGDYVIINIADSTVEITDNDGDTLTSTNTVTITSEDGTTTLFAVSKGDHIIVNAVSDSSFTFDHLNTSAAVDAVNGLMGSVNITRSRKLAVNGFTNGTANDVLDIDDVVVLTDTATNNIELKTPFAVSEASDIDAHVIPQAAGARSLVASELSITETTDENNTGNTKLNAKIQDGTAVTVEFPDEDGKMLVSNGNGTKDFLSKFDANGGLIDSTVSQTQNGTLHTVSLGDNFHINYDALAELFRYTRDETTITRLFDHDSSTVNSETQESRTHDENTVVILDEDSAIDGGVWE